MPLLKMDLEKRCEVEFMILVYVCPFCKEVRIVSRRKEVNCLICNREMVLSDLTFLEWTQMTESQRKAYGVLWNKKNRHKNES